MRMEIESETRTITFKVTLSQEDAQAIYAALDFPDHDEQPSEYVDVWTTFSEYLGDAFGWDLLPAASTEMKPVTSL